MHTRNLREFHEEDVVDSYLKEKLLYGIPRGKIMDFIPIINSATDEWIMKKWQDFFTKKKVPWIVTEYFVDRRTMINGRSVKHVEKRKTLWKERMALDVI